MTSEPRDSEPEKVYVVGFPKSGNTWLCRLLADILDSPVGSVVEGKREIAADLNAALMRRDSESRYKIIKTHAPLRSVMRNYDPEIRRVVYIERDFRDIVISGFFYRQIKKNISEEDTVRARPLDVLRRGPFGIFRYCRNRWLLWTFLKSVCSRWENKEIPVGSWNEHLADAELFSQEHPDVHVVFARYEDLLLDAKSVVTDILHRLDISVPPEQKIINAVQQQSFESKKRSLESLPDDAAIPRGKTFNVKFMRKGKAGDWVNYFSRRMARVLHAAAGDTLLRHGFEPVPDWFDKL